MTESNYLTLPISTEHAHRIDPIEYCQSREPNTIYFDYRMYMLQLDEIFNPDWIDMVNDYIPSPLTHAIAFYRETDSSIHQDYAPPHRTYRYAYNYTIGKSDSTMTWYDTNPPSIHNTQWPGQPVYPVQSLVLPETHLTLVNTSRFHAIHTNTPRWTMSLKTDNTDSWEETIRKHNV